MLPSGYERRRQRKPARPPRLTLRRALFLLCVLASFFFIVRWTNPTQAGLECIASSHLQRLLATDAIFVHPSSRLTYLPFDGLVSKNKHQSNAGLSITAGDPLPNDCLEKHFALGITCRTKQSPHLDFVWTWINSSDPLVHHAINMMAYDLKHDAQLGRPFQGSLKPKEYRDHDELRYSMRSVLKHYTTTSPNFHLVVSDIPAKQCKKAAPLRLAQLPQWLNASQVGNWHHAQVALKVWYHAQLFPSYVGSIFHSYAIESVLGRIPTLSEHFIYMNDDFFLTSSLRAADFYTNAFGPVLRLQSDLLVAPHRGGLRASEEWQALEHTNGLLSDRFGARWRPYATHQAKILGKSILAEVTNIWAQNIATTAGRPFRGLSVGEGETYIVFLYTHYIIERWREAILWTWLVGKIGSGAERPGMWGPKESQAAWRDLGGVEGANVLKAFKNANRETLSDARLRRIIQDEEGGSGDGERLRTAYVFASDDGYPFTGFGQRGALAWRPEPDKHDPGAFCQIHFEDCFASVREGEPVTLDGAFKRIAFDRSSQCGDCVITALVATSGPLGLSPFLPPAGRLYTPSKLSQASPQADMRDPKVPMLPMTANWWKTDFSLDAVLGRYVEHGKDSFDLRTWSMILLQRYRFVIGETPSKFASLQNPASTRRILSELPIREAPSSLALLCLNDDVGYGDWKVGELVREWLGEKWPEKAEWEK